MEWTVTSAVLAVMRSAAAAAHPRECCGLLLGRGQAIVQAVPAANVAAEPWHRFEIDPATLIAAHRAARAGGPAVLGYYHSHPTGDARPSATDQAQAAGDGRVWAIVAACDVCWWQDDEAGFVQLSCSLAES
ncbi:Mov34/MPN/PAD-1 family protein [Croceibacterium ferulae]|uniref:Mov34/MPN/PAD-1 family protein n=1 Tax=Croceibacterium ferulae TaxID=1854641 RepID=UPI000EAE9319|nr:M67 family metallopeptidase [Croceibacterium ferulae]